MKSGFLKFLFAALALSLGSFAPLQPAHAAFGGVYCAPATSGAAEGPKRVVNPNTSTAYSLNGQGCAFIANADIGYFLSQGYTQNGTLYTLVMTGITANTTTANSPILPAGAFIHAIVIAETAGNAVTGGVDIGTAASGAQIASAFAVGASSLSAITGATILLRLFGTGPLPASQQIFFTCHTACNSASLNATIVYSLF